MNNNEKLLIYKEIDALKKDIKELKSRR